MRTMRTVALLAAFGVFIGSIPARAEPLIPALERLAEADDAEAIYHLGMAYQVGSGVDRDPARALDAFRRAAALGDPLAAYKLGCYYDGQGQGLVADDPVLALRHKSVAAEAGYALAQQDVAGLHARNGDMAEALTWLKRAADQGWSAALAIYASIHNGADGVQPDPAITAAYFRLFLDRVDPDDAQRQWLSTFEEELDETARERARQIVGAYRAQPTALTLKGLSGVRAAQALVASRTR